MSETVDDIRFDDLKVLLVDDEPNLLRVVRRILRRRGAEVETAGNGLEALEVLNDYAPDVVLCDLKMPGLDGIGFLQALKEREPDRGRRPIVIVLTGHGTMETAIEAMRLGARDYLLKPCDPDEILLVFSREVEAERLRRENVRLRGEVSTLTQRLQVYESYGEMVGHSQPMQEVYRQIERLCQFHDMTVMIIGETGTGKELVARALHQKSPRAKKPFIAINASAIPADLQESQLFGHRRGAFTGATEDHIGAFEAADGGTLFLDEVGEMRPELQVKLLRALEQRQISPIGSHQLIDVNVRVVAATNRDLYGAVQSGDFRADLYNRLEGAILRLPPLRERVEDIPQLAAYFLQRVAQDYSVEPKQLDTGAIDRLMGHPWPGNVRELQNVVKRAFVFTNGPTIHAYDLEFSLTTARDTAPPAAPTALPATASPFAAAANGDEDDDLSLLERRERQLILDALERTGGNKSKAAELLGIDRKRLYRRLKKYALER